jgi:hypothetical protein
MSKIKHSKYKNPAIIFELLVKKITSDLLSNKESEAINILKNNFTNTELGKEYKLYETLFKNKNLTETKANIVINSVIESHKKLNKSRLKKDKYNIIKEIRDKYNLDEFFKIQLSMYKPYASLYMLLESNSSETYINPEKIINSKLVLLEQLTNNKETTIKKEELIDEFNKIDKETRILTQHILLEKFNSKYKNLSDGQKIVLKEFINSVDNKTHLKEFFNTKTKEIKSYIHSFTKSNKDMSLNIRLHEVSKYLKPLDKNDKIKDEHMIDLMQYYSLIEELKNKK